ncbi:MAG: T9SS type A sorting domain-containing protein [Bacteroidales bacterium]|jgi:hypothetical protein
MKSRLSAIIPLLLSIMLCISYLNSYPQCTPMGPEECPDPENNGQVCPDSLAYGFLNQLYSQVATILPPSSDTSGIPLHNVTLLSVDNLPPGISWTSNAQSNVFLAGNYYCILMEGTPTDTGTFALKIVVNVFVNVFGFPVLAGQVTDSTSLAIRIFDDTGFPDSDALTLTGKSCYPNPFSTWTSMDFTSDSHATARLEIYSIHGKLLDLKEMNAVRGNNTFHYNGEALSPGTYYYRIYTGRGMISGKMVKISR